MSSSQSLFLKQPRSCAPYRFWCCPSSGLIAPRLQRGPTEPLWTYNDSMMYLVSKGQVREFHYQEPRPALGPFGVTPGTLAFRGVSRDGE